MDLPESVIPTGATRLFLAHGLCAPGRGVERSWQGCSINSVALHAKAVALVRKASATRERYGRPNVNRAEPAATAIYSFPSTA
jgi:hypothetical protein